MFHWKCSWCWLPTKTHRNNVSAAIASIYSRDFESEIGAQEWWVNLWGRGETFRQETGRRTSLLKRRFSVDGTRSCFMATAANINNELVQFVVNIFCSKIILLSIDVPGTYNVKLLFIVFFSQPHFILIHVLYYLLNIDCKFSLIEQHLRHLIFKHWFNEKCCHRSVFCKTKCNCSTLIDVILYNIYIIYGAMVCR